MGSRVIMMLGWKGEDILEKANQLGVSLNPEVPSTFYKIQAEEVHQNLINIQRGVIKNYLKFEILEEQKNEYSYSFEINSSFGEETLSAMKLITVGAVDLPNDITYVSFGVELNGTFYPVIMDWEGSWGEGAFSFTLTKEKIALFEHIKQEIVKIYPVFSDAEWIFELDWA